MSREMTMKLNQILYQRSKDWLENKPKTGILNMLGRGKPDEYNEKGRSSFDDYLRGHIRTSNKTINIRGLFRVPDIPRGERLMIDVEEKERDMPQREQKEQVPISNIDEGNLNLPSGSNEAPHQASRVMMSYPLGKVSKSFHNFPEPEMFEIEEKESINYYIDLAKQQPGKKLAIISKKNRDSSHGNNV